MSKIESLTPEQEAMLPQIAEECLQIGLSTKKMTDELKVQCIEYAKMAYRAANLTPPEHFEFHLGPMQGMEAANRLMGTKDTFISPFCGSFEINWYSFYYAFDRMGFDCVKPLDGLAGLIKNAGWCWMFDEACIITQQPTEIHLDAEGRLHSESGPAIAYEDGWKLYYIHNVAVTEQIVERPETLTIDQIEKEVNAEVRRIMVERFGREKFLKESGAKVVSLDFGGTLYLKEIRGEQIKMLELINSTPEPDGTSRMFYLRVPPDVKSVKQGVAWMHGLTEDQYHPEVET